MKYTVIIVILSIIALCVCNNNNNNHTTTDILNTTNSTTPSTQNPINTESNETTLNKMTHLVIGQQNKQLTINSNSECQEYYLRTNHKHIQFKLNSFDGVNKVLITDKKLANCNVHQCHENSNICQSTNIYYNYFDFT